MITIPQCKVYYLGYPLNRFAGVKHQQPTHQVEVIIDYERIGIRRTSIIKQLGDEPATINSPCFFVEITTRRQESQVMVNHSILTQNSPSGSLFLLFSRASQNQMDFFSIRLEVEAASLCELEVRIEHDAAQLGVIPLYLALSDPEVGCFHILLVVVIRQSSPENSDSNRRSTQDGGNFGPRTEIGKH
jgi:hypothetical protein